MMREDADATRSGAHHNVLPRAALLAIFAGALIAFFALGGNEYLHLQTVKQHRDALHALLAGPPSGYQTALPPDLKVVRVAIHDRLATVTLSRRLSV